MSTSSGAVRLAVGRCIDRLTMTYHSRPDGNMFTDRSFVGLAAAALALLALLGAAASGPAMAAQSNTTAADATAAKERASALLTQLQNLNDNHPGLVADDLIESVKNSIENGDSEFELGRYGEAKSEYETASEKASGGLKTYYADATKVHLAAANQTIQQYQNEQPGRAQELQSRSQEIRSDLQAAESVSDYEDVHDRAAALAETVKADLQPTLVDKIVANLSLAITVLFVLVLVGFVIQSLRVRLLGTRTEITDTTTDNAPYQGNNQE